jgi:hypothetical protein
MVIILKMMPSIQRNGDYSIAENNFAVRALLWLFLAIFWRKINKRHSITANELRDDKETKQISIFMKTMIKEQYPWSLQNPPINFCELRRYWNATVT